ncbi:MAG: hypothetical protein MJ145_03590, partial [Clostridia bacterium]|nr:hypothetical protein [Clostridia bacterium]
MLKHRLVDATSEELAELREYFSARNYHSSNHSFSSVYMWGFGYSLSWEVIDGYLWLLYEYEDEDGSKSYWSTAP